MLKLVYFCFEGYHIFQQFRVALGLLSGTLPSILDGKQRLEPLIAVELSGFEWGKLIGL